MINLTIIVSKASFKYLCFMKLTIATNSSMIFFPLPYNSYNPLIIKLLLNHFSSFEFIFCPYGRLIFLIFCHIPLEFFVLLYFIFFFCIFLHISSKNSSFLPLIHISIVILRILGALYKILTLLLIFLDHEKIQLILIRAQMLNSKPKIQG